MLDCTFFLNQLFQKPQDCYITTEVNEDESFLPLLDIACYKDKSISINGTVVVDGCFI